MTKIADNVNPDVYDKGSEREVTADELNEDVADEIDQREVFDLIRNINDPEHPLTLEELRVVEEKNIFVDNEKNVVDVFFTPTIPHCSMATLIGKSFKSCMHAMACLYLTSKLTDLQTFTFTIL